MEAEPAGLPTGDELHGRGLGSYALGVLDALGVSPLRLEPVTACDDDNLQSGGVEIERIDA